MKRQIAFAWVALAGAASLVRPAYLTAADGGFVPYDPRLIVPIPVLRRHACAADYSVPFKRGVAILSPIESPDHDCPIVGGKPLCVPYYPDYCPHGSRGPRLGIPGNGIGYSGPTTVEGLGAMPGAELPSGIAESASYGCYSGASQNESALLHLGGLSTPNAATRPAAAPDLIDLIESRQ